MSFVRAIAKYYNNDETTDQCTVELYDVEPGGSDGYYYLLDAGHKLSVDFLVARVTTHRLSREPTPSPTPTRR